MPAKDKILGMGRQWVSLAEADWRAARHLVGLQDDCPTEVVCFHAQQCVEKYLKAALVIHSIEFSKTHDIAVLARLLPAAMRVDLTLTEQERLTDYATAVRYPGDDEPVALAEAQQAVAVASRVRETLRQHLPSDAL